LAASPLDFSPRIPSQRTRGSMIAATSGPQGPAPAAMTDRDEG